MPKYRFGDEDNQSFEIMPAGDYPYEITGVSFEIQSGGKTSGAEVLELKVKFFRDITFETPLAQFTERLIFHKTCLWKIDTFVKSSNMMVNGSVPSKDQEIEFTESEIVGLRGWATVRVEKYKKTDGSEGTSNKVAVWITNKPKLARRSKIDPEDVPTAQNDDDLF
jgi:hypothetical protein